MSSLIKIRKILIIIRLAKILKSIKKSLLNETKTPSILLKIYSIK